MMDLHAVDVVILAGGQGERLRSVVNDRSKVLAAVDGRPFISYLFDQLCVSGIRQVTLATGYLGEDIESTLGVAYKNLRIQYSMEDEPLGTGGAVRKAADVAHGEWALVLNGDSFVDIDFRDFLGVHQAKKQQISIAVVTVKNASRYGSLAIGSEGKITAFNEKKMDRSDLPGLINAGVYLIHWSLLRALPDHTQCSLERQFFPSQIAKGIYGYRTKGEFIDIGTPETLTSASEFFRHRDPAVGK
jgi:D-glycero-alpha-D-manno-heptose 1-phosphate guanylyltransferase